MRTPDFLRGYCLAGILAGSIFSSIATADCISYSCNGSRILGMYTSADGNAYIKVSGNTSALSCTLVSGVYVKLPAGSSRFKEIYGSLLAYQLADRLVDVRMADGVTECTIGYIYSESP
jgi:hypothetical protein